MPDTAGVEGLQMRWWPRSIRWQMLATLLLLEAVSIVLFAALMFRQQAHDMQLNAQRRLTYVAASMATQAGEALQQQQPGWVGLTVKLTGDSPIVALAKITDPAGNVQFVSRGDADGAAMDPLELAQIPLARSSGPHVFSLGGNRLECVAPIYAGSSLRGFAWVQYNQAPSHQRLNSLLEDTAIFGVIWLLASAVLMLLMAHSITQPLSVLRRGTHALMSAQENSSDFPLPVTVHNEIGDLMEAFNRMVASIAEHRTGLNDTLSLLDSMLANAPIGLAFFDRHCRMVRLNQVFAEMTGFPLSRHLGRTLPELLPRDVAQELESTVRRVFDQGEPVRELELNGAVGKPGAAGKTNRPWTWLASAYPVRTTPQQVRWVGVIVLDTSSRKRSEEALRKSEKLAATGRLAASIAHEINNPLEAITNLLFMLHNYCQLDDQALNYVVLAEHEVRRIAEITQQTLRFYRQSTLPTRANMSELLDSVLSLHHGQLNALNIQVERDYDADMDLFCFAGEIRQVFANLVGNTIDATGPGGRLMVRARRSRHWKNPQQTGVRFAVADTGVGMEPEVRERIFEAFFTTKEATGTGLGLWLSHEIILKHHGLVHVRSRTAAGGKSSGSVFQIFIPDDPHLTAATRQTAEVLVQT